MDHQRTRTSAAMVLLGTIILSGASVAAARTFLSESKIEFLVDRDPLTYWSTPGRAAEQEERVDLDMGAVVAGGPVEGTGLGLAIVKQIVDLHGGRIQMNSEEGQGTSFVAELPATY